MTKRFVRVVIVGLTNRGNLPEHNVPEYEFYTTVNIVQPKLDIEKLERSISGAEIIDYPYLELFDIYTGSNVNRVIYNDDDIEKDDVTFYIEKQLGETSCPYSVGENLWLHDECVTVNYIGSDSTKWILTLIRGQFGTVAKKYMGLNTAFNCSFFMYNNVLKTTRNSFTGLIVELRDPDTNDIIAPYVISGYGITEEVVSIQLEHIFTTLNVEIVEEKQLTALNPRFNMVDATMALGKIIEEGLGIRGSSDNYNLGFYENQSSISKYLDSTKTRTWLRQISEKYVLPFVNIKGQVSDMIRFCEIISHSFLTWNFTNQSFSITEFFIERYYFNEITNITLSDYKTETKTITKPAMPPSGMEIEFNNGKRKFSSRNIVSGGRGTTVNLKLNFDATDEITAGIRDAYEHIYARLTDYAVAKIEIKVAPHLEDYFSSGRLFEIEDIYKYNTFQQKGSEIFTKGMVLSCVDGVCNILVTTIEEYTPMLPMIPMIRNIAKSTETKTYFTLLSKSYLPAYMRDYLIVSDNVNFTIPNIPTSTEKYFDSGDTVDVWYQELVAESFGDILVSGAWYKKDTYVLEEIIVGQDDVITFVFDGKINNYKRDFGYIDLPNDIFFMSFKDRFYVSDIKKTFSYPNEGRLWR